MEEEGGGGPVEAYTGRGRSTYDLVCTRKLSIEIAIIRPIRRRTWLGKSCGVKPVIRSR